MDGRAVLVLVALVALAGCGAVPLGGNTPADPTETLTPVPVSTETPTSTPTDRPPGVAPSGTVNAARLREAHKSFLDGRSYEWRLVFDLQDSEDPTAVEGFTRQAFVDGDRFFVEQRDENQPVVQSLFVNETGGYLRGVTGNETRTETTLDPGVATDYAVGGRLIGRFLTGMNANVTTAERNGETYYRLHATGTAPSALRRLGTAVSDYRVTAYVSPEGFVRTLVVRYDRVWNENRERVYVRFDYSGIGTTGVEKPDWVDELDPPTPEAPPSVVTSTPGNESTPSGSSTPATAATAPTTTPGTNETETS
ncbi:hypothetical protein BRC60_03895 [Halobacteriales archaeon QH_1_68_42]|nr:MAG: hypothetical protein BRC60_03895 [Halobacteriales archaeon QH_1_68_42]